MVEYDKQKVKRHHIGINTNDKSLTDATATFFGPRNWCPFLVSFFPDSFDHGNRTIAGKTSMFPGQRNEMTMVLRCFRNRNELGNKM